MKDATKFVEAVSNLYTNVGPIWAILIIVVIFAVPLSYRLYRDKQLQDAYRGTINEKEKQIQRLAKDNREWRNYFWRSRGLTEQEITEIESNTDATPLTSPPSDIRSEN